MLDGLSVLTTENPEKFKSMGGANDPVPFYTIFTGMMLVQLFYWGTNQQIIQRALGAKDLKEGQKGLLLASFIKILGPIIVVLPGLIAFHVFEGNLESADSAYPELVRKVLPSAWVGFFAAVLFGAILSSFNSVLNSSVTLFGIDVYKQHMNKEADEKTVVKYGKTFGVILAIAAMFIAPLIANAGSLFDYLQKINGIYSIPILTIIIVGYLTKYVPAIAAKIGLVSGCLLYIIYLLIDIYAPETFSSLHFLDIMAILFALNVAIMLLIGKIKPRKEPYVQVYTKQVDITPWKYVNITGLIISLIVVLIYIYFA
jgi:SSS family solute:Na+ symporter